MVSKSKLYAQLDGFEDELLARLVPHLQRAANGQNDLVFCTAEFNAHRELRHSNDAETESLVVLGRRILGLRAKLNEPSDACVAARICWYCQQWSDAYARKNVSAQSLAQAFLQEIRGPA